MTQSKELKQVRDALASAIKRLETIKETFPAISVDSDIKIYRDALATLDRLSAPVGVPDGFKLVPIERQFDFKKFRLTAAEYKSLEDVTLTIMDMGVLSAAPTPDPSIPPQHGVLMPEGYVTVKMGFPNITGSKELVAVPVEFLKSDGSFNKLQTAAPTPAPTEIDLDKLATEIMDKYLVGNCEHLQFGDGVVLALREIAATGRLKV